MQANELPSCTGNAKSANVVAARRGLYGGTPWEGGTRLAWHYYIFSARASPEQWAQCEFTVWHDRYDGSVVLHALC